MRPFIAESMNKDLAKISAWCKLWGMKMNLIKKQCMTLSRPITAFPPHSDLFIEVPLSLCDSFKVLGVVFCNKFTFEQQFSSVSFSVAEKNGLLKKSFKALGDRPMLHKCFKSFVLPWVKYCSPVWCSATDSHLEFFRSFIPAVIRLRNDLPHHVVVSMQLQNFKCGANVFLLSRLF